jgi:hypothetical protein
MVVVGGGGKAISRQNLVGEKPLLFIDFQKGNL